MNRLLCCIILFFFTKFGFSQISISAPLNNGVYQRSSTNTANLIISGTYSSSVLSSIQARLVNPDNSQPISGFDWKTIINNPSKGYFYGVLSNVPAGWYLLEVRSLKSGLVMETSSINRVGVGDVFMIAGQSNAQGYFNNNYIGTAASSPKVVTHNNGMYCSPNDIPFPSLSQITSTTKPGTAGLDSWCYGALGDNIVNTTGLPVAFFNSGAAGSSSVNWVVSANGGATNHPFSGEPFCKEYDSGQYPNGTSGMPYLNFRKGLNLYNSMFGARAVLWHQGETDKYYGVSQSTYSQNLQTIISKSRTHYNDNLPWVIARVSYENAFQPYTSSAITTAQTNIPNTLSQTFLGPETDLINNTTYPGSRDGQDLHFTLNGGGLTLLANAWSNYLNPAFFTNSVPIPASVSPTIIATISASNQAVMTTVGSYSSYKWIRTDVSGNSNFGNASEGTTNTLTKTSGTYRCWVTDAKGNQQISNPIDVTKVLQMGQVTGTCTAHGYLSEQKYYQALNGEGPVEINKTNGGEADGDGTSIVLKGIPYDKGLGVSGNSEVVYKLPATQFYKLTAKLGIGDEVSSTCNNTGGVVYKVYGDGNLVYTSPTVFRNSALINLDLNIIAYKELKLTTEEVATNTTCNRAIWADATIFCANGDTTKPTSPGNLVAQDTTITCLNFTWAASTDDIGVAGYYIYKNNIKIDSVSATTLSYYLKGLGINQSILFGVEAFDFKNNKSVRATKTINIPGNITADYGNVGNYFCSGRTYLPKNMIPKGGTFAFNGTYVGATINSTTGAFNATLNDVYNLQYTIGANVPDCIYVGGFVLGTVSPPLNTPTITSNKTLVNKDSLVVLNSSTCDVGATLWWNFSAATTATVQAFPSDTTTYKAACRKNECYNYSNEIIVKTIPNCHAALNLVSPKYNLSNTPGTLYFNSSNTLEAQNTLSPAAKINYNAAQSILLKPGFSIEPGVIFSAKIQNCPN
jgi:hypothetical protein